MSDEPQEKAAAGTKEEVKKAEDLVKDEKSKEEVEPEVVETPAPEAVDVPETPEEKPDVKVEDESVKADKKSGKEGAKEKKSKKGII